MAPPLPSRFTRALVCALGLFAAPVLADRTLDDDEPGVAQGRVARPLGAPPPLLQGAPVEPTGPTSLPITVQPGAAPVLRKQLPPLRKASTAPGERPAIAALQTTQLPLPPQGHRFAPLARVQVGGTTYTPYSFDGHVHSEHSPDADHPVTEMLVGAERVGLSALVLTDHGSARSALSFPKYKGPVKAFVGQEIGGPYGHAVWWNVDAALPARASSMSLAERAAYAHERGGLIVLCHPGWWIGGREEDPMKWITPDALKEGGISGDIDALELWNGVYDKPLPKLIAAWVDALEAGVFVPIVGNSDFHRFRAHRLGGPRNVALCDTPDVSSCMWSAIKAGRSYVTDGPTLTMDVGGKTYGEAAQVAHGAPLKVSLEVLSPRGGELRLYLGRQLVQSWPLALDAQQTVQWSGNAPGADSYLRAEIVRSIPGREDPIFELLSNPVRVVAAP